MSLNLANYQEHARDAVKAFWGNRAAALQKQAQLGNTDAGTRGAVTAGKNLDGFRSLVRSLVEANGLTHAELHVNKGLVVLPGFFRPTKQWDMLIMNDGRLVAALEFKSQVGSFGNNYNNRTEEAIGTAQCFKTVCREGGLGEQPPPFLGWLMIVEDSPKSRKPVRNDAPHFKVLEEFSGASYLKRYDLLCQKLVKEQLYSAAALIATEKSAVDTGDYSELSELSSLGSFVATFAGHIAAEASRQHSLSRLIKKT